MEKKMYDVTVGALGYPVESVVTFADDAFEAVELATGKYKAVHRITRLPGTFAVHCERRRTGTNGRGQPKEEAQ
jgi:hypothetical protein